MVKEIGCQCTLKYALPPIPITLEELLNIKHGH